MKDQNDPVAAAPLYRYRFGGCEFDEARMRLTVAGAPVELEPKPLQLLAELLRRADEVVTREELLESVWTHRVIGEQVLTNTVAKLRKALGESGERIVTLPRLGYRLIGPVERAVAGRKLSSRLELEVSAPVPGREHYLLEAQLSSTPGMEVWRARHAKSGDRRVFKFCRDGEHLASLRREITLYRVLTEGLGERQDLIRILDWNFDTPPYHIECEFGGENLLTWAGHDGALSRLSLPERIGLFLQIADAVAAAHSVGVLHKDLKPANILIAHRTAEGLQVRVGDFGSGRLLEPERLEALGITRLGMTVADGVLGDSGTGTPLYLAPELIAGAPPTVQSDVYALGLILYQLVVGDLRQPLASGWESGIADSFMAQDIAAATQLDPACRLASVAELTQRLRSLDARRREATALQEARAESARAQRALELTRARRPWVAAASVTLLLGLIASASLYVNERRARQDADHAAAQAEAIDQFLSNDLLGAADPGGADGSHNPTMREVLARTASRLDERFRHEPEIEASVALALGNAYFGLTDYAAAETYRRRAVALLSATQGAASPATLEAQYQLISILVQTNRLDEAARALAAADRLAGSRLDGNTRLAFQAHWTRAGYDKLRMNAAAAATDYAAAERVRAVVYPDDDSMQLRLRDALSWCDVRLGRNAEAERVLRDLMTPAWSPGRVGPLFWAQARIDYGIALRSLGRDADAERVMKAALGELRTALGPEHFFVGVVQNELGDLYTRQSRWAEAIASLNDAFRIIRQHSGEHGQATLIVGANLGIVQYQGGHYRESAERLTGIHTELVELLGENSPQAQAVAYYLASSLNALGRGAEARSLVGTLQPDALASAEPRDDWGPRVQQLRAAVLKSGR